jgi:hypothetical protein
MKNYIEKKFEKELASVTIENKINLDNIAHMEGTKDAFLKLKYINIKISYNELFL